MAATAIPLALLVRKREETRKKRYERGLAAASPMLIKSIFEGDAEINALDPSGGLIYAVETGEKRYGQKLMACGIADPTLDRMFSGTHRGRDARSFEGIDSWGTGISTANTAYIHLYHRLPTWMIESARPVSCSQVLYCYILDGFCP